MQLSYKGRGVGRESWWKARDKLDTTENDRKGSDKENEVKKKKKESLLHWQRILTTQLPDLIRHQRRNELFSLLRHYSPSLPRLQPPDTAYPVIHTATLKRVSVLNENYTQLCTVGYTGTQTALIHKRLLSCSLSIYHLSTSVCVPVCPSLSFPSCTFHIHPFKDSLLTVIHVIAFLAQKSNRAPHLCYTHSFTFFHS